MAGVDPHVASTWRPRVARGACQPPAFGVQPACRRDCRGAGQGRQRDVDEFDFSRLDSPPEPPPKSVAPPPVNELLAIFQAGLDRHRQGDLSSALAIYGEVLKRDPENHDALHLLGLATHQSGRSAEGVALISRGIALNPKSEAMFSNRAAAQLALGRHAEALADFDRAIALKPELPEAYQGRGNALQALKRPDEAVASYDKALALRPLNPGAQSDKGNAQKDLGRREEAVASYDAALALDPKFAVAWYNRAGVLRELGRIGDAIESYGQAIAIQPDFAAAHHNLATCLLLEGRFEAGFREYEWRRKAPDFANNRTYPGPGWTGVEDIAGKTLFIYPELFLGDLIQFGRYALLAEARGARVILAAPQSLHALLQTLSPTLELIATDATPPSFDYQCALMSLPLAFETELATIPAPSPYLKADPARSARWGKTIGDRGFRIGVCWQGSTAAYAASMQRSFPLAQLQAMAGLPDVRLISLQKHDGLDQLADLPAGMTIETLGKDFDEGPDAFVDTAAVIANCDLVITADTAVAHVAGALGAPTWIALPHVPDWRWMEGRSDSPWYPSARLFRQDSAGDWAAVFAEMAAALSEDHHA